MSGDAYSRAFATRMTDASKSRAAVSAAFLAVLALALARVIATRPPGTPVETTFFVDLGVLLPLVVFALLIAWLDRRFPHQHWFEQQMPWLFPAEIARHQEAIARERPLNFLGMTFLFTLGAFSIAGDIGNFRPSPLLRYGAASIVSMYVLYTTRRRQVARRVRSSSPDRRVERA